MTKYPPSYPFTITCHIYKRPYLRDIDDVIIFAGVGVLRSLFDTMTKQEHIRRVSFDFPERWLNIVEQRQLYDRLHQYMPNLESVTLKTHSPFIIQVTPHECAFLVVDNYPDDVDEAYDRTVRLYYTEVA